MTNEERDLINQFIGRVSGAQAGGQPAQFGGSVPATVQPALPPVDPDADRLIRDLFQRYPEAPYRITQLAFVQEHALTEAHNRMQRLEWELQQAQQAAQAAQQTAAQQAPAQPVPAAGGGFFGGLFGSGRTQAPPPPQPGASPIWNQGAAAPPPAPQWQQAAPPPQYPPNYQPGMFQRSGGSGFLGSALTTAAGVAGGMVAGNALMNLFSGHQGYGGGLVGGAPFGGNPWGGAAPPPADYVDQGTWDNTGGVPGGNQDFVDNGTWDQPAADPGNADSAWDNSGGSDPSWDAGGTDSGSNDSLC